MTFLVELLDSLKQSPRSTSRHSADHLASVREQHQSSEVTALKTRLAEIQEYARKLKTKNGVYEKEILKLRTKELELAKAFSLTEVCIRNKVFMECFLLKLTMEYCKNQVAE